MLTATVKDLRLFETFLGVIGKFTQQCQFTIRKDGVSVYCKNPSAFTTARLLLDSTILILDSKAPYDEVKLCIRDIYALRSSIGIILDLKSYTDENKIDFQLDEKDSGKDGVYIKSIRYDGSDGGGFKLISIDPDVIEEYVSSDLKTAINKDWSFNVIVKNLDMLQNKTTNIVSLQDVGIYIKEDAANNSAIMSLESKKTASSNSISLPIGKDCTGTLRDCVLRDNIMIHESSMRIMNILKVSYNENITCSFDKTHNVFFVESFIETMTDYIKARLLIQLIAGGK